MAGQPLKGVIYVDPAGIAEDGDLKAWLDRCMNFMNALPPKYRVPLFLFEGRRF